MKNVAFYEKTSKFLPKRSLCLFIFCIFYLNEKELNQQVCIKYTENEISNSVSQNGGWRAFSSTLACSRPSQHIT